MSVVRENLTEFPVSKSEDSSMKTNENSIGWGGMVRVCFFLAALGATGAWAQGEGEGDLTPTLSECMNLHGDTVRSFISEVSRQRADLISKKRGVLDSLFEHDATLVEKKNEYEQVRNETDSTSRARAKELAGEIMRIRSELYEHEVVVSIENSLDVVVRERSALVDSLSTLYPECTEAFARLKR